MRVPRRSTMICSRLRPIRSMELPSRIRVDHSDPHSLAISIEPPQVLERGVETCAVSECAREVTSTLERRHEGKA